MAQLNIPKLRFPEFSEEWKKTLFKDIFKVNQGLQIPITERLLFEEPDSQFYITNEFLKSSTNKRYYIKNAPKSVICSKDDILMTRTGNTGVVVTNVAGAFHNNFFKISYPPTVHKDFLFYFLNLPITQSLISKLAGTSTIPDLNHSDFYRLILNYPAYTEQQKIASFLSAVDKKIEQLQKKKELLEQYKKAMMQKLFNRKIRFKDDNGKDFPEWEEKELGNLTKRNICYGVVQPGFENKIGINFIRGGDIFKGKINDNLRMVSQKVSDKSKKTYLEGGELLMSLVGYPGETAVVQSKLKGANIARQVGLIDLKDTVNTFFIHHYLSSVDGKKNVLKKVTGSAQQVINIVDLKRLEIPLPSLTEQTKIADFLTAIDNKIALTSKELKGSKTFKKGLLQQMFV